MNKVLPSGSVLWERTFDTTSVTAVGVGPRGEVGLALAQQNGGSLTQFLLADGRRIEPTPQTVGQILVSDQLDSWLTGDRTVSKRRAPRLDLEWQFRFYDDEQKLGRSHPLDLEFQTNPDTVTVLSFTELDSDPYASVDDPFDPRVRLWLGTLETSGTLADKPYERRLVPTSPPRIVMEEVGFWPQRGALAVRGTTIYAGYTRQTVPESWWEPGGEPQIETKVMRFEADGAAWQWEGPERFWVDEVLVTDEGGLLVVGTRAQRVSVVSEQEGTTFEKTTRVLALYLFNPDGSLQWSEDFEDSSEVPRFADVRLSAALTSGGHVAVSGPTFDLATGRRSSAWAGELQFEE